MATATIKLKTDPRELSQAQKDFVNLVNAAWEVSGTMDQLSLLLTKRVNRRVNVRAIERWAHGQHVPGKTRREQLEIELRRIVGRK